MLLIITQGIAEAFALERCQWRWLLVVGLPFCLFFQNRQVSTQANPVKEKQNVIIPFLRKRYTKQEYQWAHRLAQLLPTSLLDITKKSYL